MSSKPGQIGSSSPAIVVRDVVVVGAAMIAGTAPPSKTHVPGYVRGFDVRTGSALWTFHTIPQPGEFGNETWEDDSVELHRQHRRVGAHAGRRGARLRLPARRGSRPTTSTAATAPATTCSADSLVCLDAKTGKRVWHFQLVHHGIWDYDFPCAADPRRHHRRRQADQGGRAGHQAGLHLRVRSRDRHAGVADRGAAGAAVRRARRADLADAAVSDQARRPTIARASR